MPTQAEKAKAKAVADNEFAALQLARHIEEKQLALEAAALNTVPPHRVSQSLPWPTIQPHPSHDPAPSSLHQIFPATLSLSPYL